VGCVAAIALGPTQLASADDSRADLVRVSAGNIVVTSGNCKYTPVSVSWYVEPGYEVWSANADVYHGGQVVDSHDLTDNSNYFWCPYVDGVGTFRFGPATQVSFSDPEYNELLTTDDTTGYFSARLNGRLYQSVVKSTSNKVTVKVVHQRYDLSRNSYVAWAPSSTKLQYQLSNGSWYTYKTLGNTGSTGTYSFYTAATRNYRAVSTSAWNVWGRTSATVRR
jgi:hypothetical protein